MTTDASTPILPIHLAIPAVMEDVEAIGKNRKNVGQGYAFRGIDDLYNALNASLAKFKVFTIPEVLDAKREEHTTKNGGVTFSTYLRIRYTIYAGDGSHLEAVMEGEAMDSGDKSTNKAMSAAQKYLFLQVFAIPTEEPKDSENDNHVVAKKAERPTADPLLAEMGKLATGDALAAWWTGHAEAMKPLSDSDKARLVAKKDDLKAQFNKPAPVEPAQSDTNKEVSALLGGAEPTPGDAQEPLFDGKGKATVPPDFGKTQVAVVEKTIANTKSVKNMSAVSTLIDKFRQAGEITDEQVRALSDKKNARIKELEQKQAA